MVLMIFSEPKHVRMLRNGLKPQTTRTPRKNPVKEGDILHCYYRSRMAKTCANCVNAECEFSVLGDKAAEKGYKCEKHTSFIGVATVTKVAHPKFPIMQQSVKDLWAVQDGFKDWNEANQWFVDHHGPDWQDTDFEVIMFDGHWLKNPSIETCAPCKNHDTLNPVTHVCIAASCKDIDTMKECPLKME